MDFEIVPDKAREQVGPGGRGVTSAFMLALIAGKTLKIKKEDRDRIGGNTTTLKNRGLRLRSGKISETEVLVWTEPIDGPS